MASETQTGSIIRLLAAAKPGGRFLELGTGTGIATAWLLNGMDSGSQLDSVDNDPQALAVARRHLGGDPRATLHLAEWRGVPGTRAVAFRLHIRRRVAG
jgi:predicted O-methyltransferase YrrM